MKLKERLKLTGELCEWEVRIVEEFEYEGETWCVIEPTEFKSIQREVKKSCLIDD